MMNDKIAEAMNKQINAEFYSSYLYLSMASHFESKNLKGMARWMTLQAQEELMHSLKFINYVNESGGRVVLERIDAPEHEWDSPLVIFEETYRHECEVTALINDLVEVVQSEKNHAAYNFLQWFVNEQVEEEGTALGIVENLRLVGENGVALFMIDKELAQRVPSPVNDPNAK
jgi:ferritin